MGCVASKKDAPDAETQESPIKPREYNAAVALYESQTFEPGPRISCDPATGPTPRDFSMIDPRIDPYRRRLPVSRTKRLAGGRAGAGSKRVHEGFCPDGFTVLSYAIDGGSAARVLHKLARQEQKFGNREARQPRSRHPSP